MLVIVYRPVSKVATSVLFVDFANLVEHLAVCTAPDVIVSDINLHLKDQSALSAVNFQDILDGAVLIQHAVGPTLRTGHTQNIVISQYTTRGTVHVDLPIISDHSLITAEFYIGACAELHTKETTRLKQLWKELDVEAFRRDILSSTLNTDLPDDMSAYFSLYDLMLHILVDKHVATKNVVNRSRLCSPWFNHCYQVTKRVTRCLE